ncbi:glycosyltransferase family 2 protein [Paenibacillus pinistramenti]|uniref:glycosyltransferase family 2 protein n=1 Tax=Paenibacillus pinistramenti TaxID=1768003 RepID=UPI0011094B12|nr:glycosyltransferase family 2 protein [Paenibacillus pinistramenti]
MVGLSIIIPVYNVEDYISKCLDSILDQTYTDYEILLIDDGSKDNSLNICKEYEQQDSRIRVFQQPNKGPSAARNLGISHAKGTYLAFIDSDDYIKPDMFSELMGWMHDTQTDLVISPMTVEYLYFKNRKMLLPTLEYDGKINISPEDAAKVVSLFETAMINSPCARLYKTDIIKTNRILMPDGIDYSEDLMFNIEYLKYCRSIFLMNKSYYFYTKKKQGSITTSYRHQQFHSFNLAHDKALEYLHGILGISGELENKAYYIFIPNIIISFINLFYKDCPMSRSEKMAYIHSILRDQRVREKIDKAYKPGLLPKVYKRLLTTKRTSFVYYACKLYRYYKISFQDLSRRTT